MSTSSWRPAHVIDSFVALPSAKRFPAKRGDADQRGDCRSGRWSAHRSAREASQPDGHRQCGWHRDPPLGRTNDDSVTGYQILRRRPREGEKTLLVHVNETGSTAAEYTDNDVTPDVGHAYRVKATNTVGLSKWPNFVNVTPTQPAEPAQNNPATGRPTISGTAQVGERLTVDTYGIADDDGLKTFPTATSGLSVTEARTLTSQVRRIPATPWLTPTRARPSRFRCPSRMTRATTRV